jgi:DNA-binding MarR family transcriptional regulator
VGERHAFDSDQRSLWRAYMRGSALLREALNKDIEAQAGMSLNEYEVLERLAEAPGGAVRMAALADCLVHSRSRLTHTVHRMESRGLVERRACEADGRGVYCAITPLGEQTFDAAEPGHAASVRAYVFDRLTPDELAVMGRVMGRIAEDLSGEGAPRAGLLAERLV